MKRLSHCRSVFVAGFQTERGRAAELAHNLQYLRAGVHLCDVAAGHFAEVLLDDPTETTLVLIDARRYSRLTRDLALSARDANIPVIATKKAQTPAAVSIRESSSPCACHVGSGALPN